jgi:hypothetical protein
VDIAQTQPARLKLALLDPQVARELRLRKRRAGVLPVVDELDRDDFRCPDERTAGSFFGHDFDPIAQCRGAYRPESPHPLIGVADTQQQIVLLSIRERDNDLHRPRRLRPVRRQRPAAVPHTRVQLLLLDSQVARKVGIIAACLLAGLLGVLVADEGLDCFAERVVQ